MWFISIELERSSYSTTSKPVQDRGGGRQRQSGKFKIPPPSNISVFLFSKKHTIALQLFSEKISSSIFQNKLSFSFVLSTSQFFEMLMSHGRVGGGGILKICVSRLHVTLNDFLDLEIFRVFVKISDIE